jgi:hypothetical protein
MRQAAFLLLLCALPGGALGQGKKRTEFRAVSPPWVMVGKPAVVLLSGQDLAPNEIRFEQPGLTGKVLKSGPSMPKTDEERKQGNTTVEVEVTPAADLKPGRYRFTLLQEGAEPTPGALVVDVPAPEMSESEPNNELRKPQVLPAGNITVNGKLDNEGVDVFRIEGKAGETWRFELFARRVNPATKLEGVLRLRDPRMAPVRLAVDQGSDCAIEYRLPADGPSVLEVFDGDNKAAGDLVYRLHVRRIAP